MEEQRKTAMNKLKVGDKVTGTISGIVKFGIFVAFDGLEGLVHISEIAWGHVKNPSDYGKLGAKVEVMVIGLDGDKISLSMKRLEEDPWLEAAKMYKIGSTVEGEVNRLTPFGVFVKLSDEINGLIHITELGAEVKDPAEMLKIGQKVKAKVIAVEPEEHRVGLSIKALSEEPKKKIKKAEELEAEEEAKKTKKSKKSEEEGEEKEEKVEKKKAKK